MQEGSISCRFCGPLFLLIGLGTGKGVFGFLRPGGHVRSAPDSKANPKLSTALHWTKSKPGIPMLQ